MLDTNKTKMSSSSLIFHRLLLFPIISLLLFFFISSDDDNNNNNNKVEAAPVAQTYCWKIVEAAAFSTWCGASGGCRVDAPFNSLCSGRGSCLIKSSDPSTTTSTFCTDCSWTLTGPNAGGDTCTPASTWTEPPADLTSQLAMLSRQLVMPFVIFRMGNFRPGAMMAMNDIADESVPRPSQNTETYRLPRLFLFLDDNNNTFNRLRFGVVSPIFGFTSDPTLTGVNLDKSYLPTLNYYNSPMPHTGHAVDYTTTYEFAEMNIATDLETSFEVIIRQSEDNYYVVNEQAASRDNLYNKESIPNIATGGSPYKAKFRPFIKQGAFFRRFRSKNMTKMVSALADSLPHEKTGAGQVFEMSVNWNSFHKNVSNFSAPTDTTNALLKSTQLLQMGAPSVPKARFLLPGNFKIKLTTTSNNWYVPVLSWRTGFWAAGQSPLLIYQGLEANPPGVGSTTTSSTRIANNMVPIAPGDVINASLFPDTTAIEDIFDFDARPVKVETVGNMCTLLYLANGSLRVIYHRYAYNHEYVASQYRRSLFEQIYLANGTSNYSNIFMKHSSFKDDFVLYQPNAKYNTIYAFGNNFFGRFGHPSSATINNTLEGAIINLTFSAAHVNHTIQHLALSDQFMVLATSAGFLYYAGNSLYGTSYFAACVLPDSTGFNLAQVSVQWVSGIDKVEQVFVGAGFTVFLRSVLPWLYGCGQELIMTPFFPPGSPPEPSSYDQFLAFSDKGKPKKVCTGLNYACVHANNNQMTCWGVATTNQDQRICSTGLAKFVKNMPPFQSGVDIDCGNSHVVVKRFEGTNVNDGSTLQSYITCGSADKGQIAGNYQLSGESTNSNLRPVFAAPNNLINAFTADDAVGAVIDYPPAYEISNMYATRDATYAVSIPRRHVSVDNMMKNWNTNLGRSPPTGWHAMHPTFGAEGPFYVDFTTFPGVPLLCVSNQTMGSAWVTPVDSAVEIGYQWLPNATAKSLKPDLGTSTPYTSRRSPSPYFINWHKFLKNTSSFSLPGSSPYVVDTNMLMNIPHLIVTMSTGEIFVLGVDALPCYGGGAKANWDTALAWCDKANPTRIIWMASGATVNAGFTNALASTAWIALNVRFRITTLNKQLFVQNNKFLNNTGFMSSQLTIVTFLAQYDLLRWNLPPCMTMGHPLDCGGAVFYEPFMKRPQTQIVTATTLASFPVNGVSVNVLDVEPTMGKYMIEMAPALASFSAETQISGGDPGVRGASQIYMGFLNVCIFVKIGGRAYYLLLKPGGTYLICTMPGSLKAGYTLPSGVTYSTSDSTPLNMRWEVIKDNSKGTVGAGNIVPGYIRIRNIDVSYSKNFDPNYEINDVFFMLGCAGAVMASRTIADVNRTYFYTSYSSFMLFTNDSIDELTAASAQWWERDDNTTTGATSILLQERLTSAIGCDGGLVIPIQPMQEITSFHTFVQTLLPLNSSEEIVITLTSPSFSSLHVKYQFVVGKGGPRIETITDTTNWVKAFNAAGRGVVASCNNPPGHPLQSYPNHWNSFSLVHDITTAKTEIWWNGKLACAASNWLGLSVGQPLLVSGVYLGIRALHSNFYAVARFREIVMCDSRTPQFKRYGCSANSMSYKETSTSRSTSLSETFSILATDTKSLVPTDSRTESETFTKSESMSESPSSDPSATVSGTISDSLTPTNSVELSFSNTSSFTQTESFSHIHYHHLYLLDFNQELVDSNLVRRTGMVLSFYLQGDLWNPYADWVNKPSGYLYFQSNLDELENPNALGYSYVVAGVLSVKIRSDNWSIMDLHVGPSGSYNSGRDETLVFRPQQEGCASKILPPNNITITIAGAGYFVSRGDRIVEVLAMSSVIVSVFALGPGSMVVRFASNLIITNFQCYNNEYFPQTWMFNPLGLRVAGSFNLGHAVGNFVVIIVIFVIFIIGMVIFKTVDGKSGWHKTFGTFGWPSLPILLSLLFVPGLMFGAWRTAFEADSAQFYFVPLAVVICVFVPLVYLYSKIMDDANFSARFEERDQSVLEIRAKKYPIFSQFQLPGQWIACDKYGEFVRQHRFLFHECTEKRRYWVLYEICVLLMESFICSITNTKYSFCGIQMLVVFLMRFALLVGAIKFHPRSASGMHKVIILLYAGQAFMAILFAAYAFQQLTNTLRSFVGYMMVGSSFTFAVLAMVCTIGAIHERYLEFQFFRVLRQESKQVNDAAPYVERTVDDVVYVDSDEEEEMMRKQLQQNEEPLLAGKDRKNMSSSGNSSSNDENNGAKSGTANVISMMSNNNNSNGNDDSVLKDLSMIQKNGKNDETVVNPLDENNNNNNNLNSPHESHLSTQEEVDQEKIRLEQEALKRKEKRNIWKLLAMEEASDEPTKNFMDYDEL